MIRSIVALAAVALVGCVPPCKEREYLDLLRRAERVQWTQGGEVGHECPICKKDAPGHVSGCELAAALGGAQ